MEPSHYAGTDAIAKQEAMAVRLAEMGVPADRAFCAATALKYVERCGRKMGASIADDIEKAANYLFRAIGGRWPWEVAVEAGPVLAADGEPLEVGQTVWHVGNGIEFTVVGLPKPGEYQSVRLRLDDGAFTGFDSDQLTHQRPVLDADGNRIEPAMDVWWVCEGDERSVHAEKLHVESIGEDGLVTCDPFNGGTWVELEPSELYVKEPVLAVDGKPLREGETVWHKQTGRAATVKGFDRMLGEPCAVIDFAGFEQRVSGALLTHEQPRNATDEERESGDLVRRARALAERGM